MLVDANILVYSADRESPFHEQARSWLSEQLGGDRTIGMPWQNLYAFVRIMTGKWAMRNPVEPAAAWQVVEDWLDSPLVWTPEPGYGHRQIASRLIKRYEPRGNLLTDTMLASLAIEHGLTICSADTDFARFSEIEWHNPVAR